MELAEAVAADPSLDGWAILDHLGTLVDKSLVVADAAEPPRYRLLESARAYALEQLALAGESAALLKRHALALFEWLQELDDLLLDGDLQPERHAARVAPETDNLRGAHDRAANDASQAELAIGIAARASTFDEFVVETAHWLRLHQPTVQAGVAPAVAARYWLASRVRRFPGTFPNPSRWTRRAGLRVCIGSSINPSAFFRASRGWRAARSPCAIRKRRAWRRIKRESSCNPNGRCC